MISTRTFIIYPYLKHLVTDKTTLHRSPELRIKEAVGLAHAISLHVVDTLTVPLQNYTAATLIGQGKVDECTHLFSILQIQLVIVDAHLSPAQQRQLERIWQCKVIDRTALILEIFGARARTQEGQLQVELASLEYQKSRLVRSWTHLERQRGGRGFLGGPGETQKETDRRLLRERIYRIEQALEKVKSTRALHRQARAIVPYPIVALVGYTNAGKSTLFNALTDAQVVAQDQLFATLDPTMRVVTLPSSKRVIVSDTVGFISDLPTELVASFRATLEEVVEAHLILHVRDVTHVETEQQNQDVIRILKDLNLEDKIRTSMIEVLNKVDLLPAWKHRFLIHKNARNAHMQVALSALSKEGISDLLTRIDAHLSQDYPVFHVRLDMALGRLLAWIYRHATVLKRQDKKKYTYLSVQMDEKTHAQLIDQTTKEKGFSFV